MNKNDKNYYRLKDDIDWAGEKKYNRVIYRTWWMVAVNLLLKILQPFTKDLFLIRVESEMDEKGNPHLSAMISGKLILTTVTLNVSKDRYFPAAFARGTTDE